MSCSTPFRCIECCQGRLLASEGKLLCPSCSAEYPKVDGVPILLPLRDESRHQLRFDRISLGQLQRIYDRAYDHEGIMGTDLDEEYDRVTKESLLAFCAPLEGRRLLDLGCGIGALWRYLPADTPVQGFALDISQIGAAKAQHRYPSLTVSVSVAEHLPYDDNFFDAVIAADTIEHTFDPDRALDEIHRVLRSGGVLAASFPIPNSLRKWGWNRLIEEHASPRFVLRLFWVVVRRIMLFGSANFQPIDRDDDESGWMTRLEARGFRIKQVNVWPEEPHLPIVSLVRAERI